MFSINHPAQSERPSSNRALFTYDYRVTLPNRFLEIIRDSHTIVHRVICFNNFPDSIEVQRETSFDFEVVSDFDVVFRGTRYACQRHFFEYVVPTPPNVSRRQAVTLISQLIERSNDFHHVFLEDVELIDGRAILSFGS